MASKKFSLPKVDGKHPLLVVRENHTPQEIADALGHANHTTVSIYCSRAKKAKNLPVPAEWCLPLARLSGLAPAAFRPDLYRPEWRV